jgi:uncharacterized membrane protein YgcG
MLRRISLSPHVAGAVVAPALASWPRRATSVDLLSPIPHKLGKSQELSADIREGRDINNKIILQSIDRQFSNDVMQFRKNNRPWELVPQFAKKRVVDMTGLLKTEHRMEIEQIIDKMQSICLIDMYVVLVPTVGFVQPNAFANSLMFNWGVGEHVTGRAGMVLVIAQQEASVHLATSYSIEEYFDEKLMVPAVKEIYIPLVKEGNVSMATGQLVYAIARHAHEVRDMWSKGGLILSVSQKNKTRLVAKTFAYGLKHYLHLMIGSFVFIVLTGILINHIIDGICPKCGTYMHRVTNPEVLQTILSKGEFLEQKNECAYYRVWKCGKCHEGTNKRLLSRDLHQNSKCLKCMDCEFYTCSKTTTIDSLPSKTEDGVKRLVYECEHCLSGREILLPLYRPVETKSEDQWYGFLLNQAEAPKKGKPR